MRKRRGVRGRERFFVIFSSSFSFLAFCICTRCDHLLFCQMHKRIYKRSNERMLLLAVFVVVFFSPFRRWYSWSSFVAAFTKCKWRKSNIHNAIIPHYYYPQHRCRRRRRRHQDKSVHLLATSNLCLSSHILEAFIIWIFISHSARRPSTVRPSVPVMFIFYTSL